MSKIVIQKYHPQFEAQVREIFFESSTKKDFKDQAEKEAFYQKYVGFYLKHFPEFCWIAVGQNVLGYVLGMPETHHSELEQIQPHLKKFEDLYDRYPAHLHINCHSSSRGLGVGGQLVLKMIQELGSQGLPGLHIMTGAQSRNRSFYQRLGFTDEVEREGILFMGRPL